MKKLLAHILLAPLLLTAVAFAEKSDDAGKSTVFFSDEVPRYTNFAVGAFGTNQYALGDWSDFAAATLGAGIDAEYTISLALPKNLDLGVSGRAEFAHVFPKSDGTLKSDNEVNLLVGAWLRVPFLLAGQTFAFQPEIAYGMILHHAKGQNGSKADGWYGDSALSLALGLRYIAPLPALKDIEFEFAPVYTFSAEKEGYSVNQLGFRLGAVWHLQKFIDQKKAEKAEREKAALAEKQRIERERQEEEARLQREEEERKKAEIERLRKEADRAAEEARRAEIASWGAPIATITASPQNFTPDGDGLNDTVTFAMGVQYLEEPTEDWTITITDPQGNLFRTIKGSGALPESVEWDGLSDKGEAVFSKNTYTATLAITPSRTDRTRSGAKTAEATVEVKTGLLLQVIMPEHEWKIVVSSIQFAGVGSNFDGLSDEMLSANTETLDEVAQQIREHPSATVTVEG